MSSNDRTPADALPLSEPVLLILLSLAADSRHGYAILQDIERISSGRVKMSTGTLYGAIRRLLDDGWIEPAREKDAPRSRQAYRLTVKGRRVLGLETARLKSLLQAAAHRTAPGIA